MCSYVNQAAGSESADDPEVSTSSNQTTQTGCLNFESLCRYRCGCCFFRFTPLEWTDVAEQKDII